MLTIGFFVLLAIAARFVGGQTCPVEETPEDMLGPFYISGAPYTRRVAPESMLQVASQRIRINGTVYGDDCVPMSKALVEIWYAGKPDSKGNLYSVGGSDMRYRARINTGACGRYSFTSLYPSLYPSRPIRHIHVRVSSGGNLLLVTQMYFKGAIPSGYNPDSSQIVTLKRLADQSRWGTFNIYVGTKGTGSATTCG